MATSEGLMGKYKQCEFCGRPLPLHFEQNLCPRCQEEHLFHEVKEFICSNTVNEYEVADHFGIPLKQVKQWIREGRIEYHTENSTGTINNIRCQRCGVPVSFGTLCPKCLKLLNSSQGSAVATPNADTRMHYLDQDGSQ